MLVAVSLWAAFFGEEHQDQLGKDLLPAIFYVSNWAQIVGEVPYFAATDPPLSGTCGASPSRSSGTCCGRCSSSP